MDTLESKAALDDVNWRILEALQADARLSYTELGRRIGLSPPAVAERVRRLEDAGIIRGYRLEVDPHKLGRPVLALIRMVARTVSCAQLSRMLAEYPEVLECHRVTGEASCILKVAVQSTAHLGEFIDRVLPYGETTTWLVLSSSVTHRVLGHPASPEC